MTTFTKDQIALQQHIEAENAKWSAECEERGATFYSTTVTDPAHWEQYDVKSIPEYERYCLISSIWDGYKEAHGFRPRFMNLNEMTMDELRKEEARIYDDIQEQIEWEEGAEARKEARKEAEIANMIANGAPDREAAERWLRQAKCA